MRVDINHVLAAQEGSSWSDLVEAARGKAQLAESLGFDGVWFGEHHFDAEGGDQCPNPVLMAGDIASRTSRLRLGLAAISLPLWHPVRLAEDLAMVDQMSGGRLDVAFSRGISPKEIVTLNPEADRRNDLQSRAIFREHLEIIREAWTADPFSWHSDRYDFPYPGTPATGVETNRSYVNDSGEITGLAVLPKPFQQPTPVLYSVTQSSEGFRTAAEQNLNVITSYPARKRLAQLFAQYQSDMKSIQGITTGMGERCGVLRTTCVAKSDEEARAILEPTVDRRRVVNKGLRSMAVWLDPDEDPADPKWDDIAPYDFMFERDLILAGSPDSVAEQMIRMSESLHIGHWLIRAGSPKISPDNTEQTIRLLAEYVLPALREALPGR